MSITRRQFLLGTSAGLILPSYYDQAVAFFGDHGKPLLVAPPRPAHILYADRQFADLGYELLLDATEPEIPSMTLEEFALYHNESLEDYLSAWQGVAPEEVNLDDYDWDEQVDDSLVMETMRRNDFPSGAAYCYLENIDLGSDLEGAQAAGELRFTDGACPGNDYLGVEAADEITLSLLQQRLNDLGLNTQIKII